MRRRTRALLTVLAVLLLAAAFTLLLYAVLPAPVESGTFPINPTLLAPPGAVP